MPAPLQPPPVAEVTRCFHCGNDCPPQPLLAESHSFCCEGCVAVWHLLHDLRLDHYYALNTHPGTRTEPAEGAASPFVCLDEPETCDRLCSYRSESLSTLTFHIPAIHCSSCIWLLEKLPALQPGVNRCEVNFLRREVHLSWDPRRVKLSAIAGLLARLGYAPHLTLSGAPEKPRSRSNRRLWYQVGVAGFSFGNIMLLSFPEYLGLEERQFATLFGWLNLVLALPVLLFSCQDYFKSAWQSLRNGQINMDVPLALGMIVLFSRSAWEIVSHSGAGYFDSFAGLLFFLLIGKAFQARTWDALSFDRDYKSYLPLSVTVKEGREEKPLAVAQLRPGTVIVTRHGELIPADGVLLSGNARIDYSFVTGESDPVKVAAGEKIFAGGRQVGSRIEIAVDREVSQSYLARLWNHETFSKPRESEVTALANRVGRSFTHRLLFIAAGAAAFWLWYDPARTAEIVTAVLIVACPCALALSLPFTLGHVMRILGRNGLYLKGPATVEQLAMADTVVFDKTGTLTQAGDAEAQWSGEALSEQDVKHLAALLIQSWHPLSRRLLRKLGPQPAMEVTDFEEVPGQGITGRIGNLTVTAGRRSFVAALHDGFSDHPEEASRDGAEVWVGINGKMKGRYLLRDQFRKNLSAALERLGTQYRLAVISGDNDRERGTLTALLPPGSEIRFRQSPEDKLNFIHSLQQRGCRVLMVGDGLNDAGALRQSDVGMSVSEDSASFTPGSDAIAAASSLERLGAFLQFSRQSLRIIRWSFLLSLLYNLTGVAFAVTGHLSPLVAAVLMPASSLSVILFTTLTTHLAARRQRL